ncbi:hypothetical protein LP085_30700 [Achromobacter sp. MY14]|uniref:hypothetical protein n=1 Tax=unclassified Achromobacter TaxID=2626865 RepID=UPI001E5A382F|nr:hypothetical protein [Achromobacter sp. MY14]MCD0501254.1 hypothetical protein [Achromobacter sp. MY14]
MTLDWNWFFSSVAQSAAAMVGVIAAFLIAKVLSNQAAFQQKRDQLPGMLVECERISERLEHCKFEYIEETYFIDWEEAVERDFDEHGSSNLDEVYERLDLKERPAWLQKSVALDRISGKLAELQAEKEKKEEAERQRELKRLQRRATTQDLRERNLYGIGSTLATFREFSDALDLTPTRKLRPMGMATRYRWDHVPNLSKEIYETTMEARHNARTVRIYLKSVVGSPERSGLVTFTLVLLVLLFFCGVIYPLSFLPAPPDGKIVLSLAAFWEILFSLKGLVLTILSVGVIAILAVFGYINLSLTYDAAELARLREFEKLGTYSSRLAYLDQRGEGEGPSNG